MGWIKKVILFLFPSLKAIIPPSPTKIEKLQKFAEQLVIESGIDLENVLVHNHGSWGQCGPRAYEFEDYCVTYNSDELGNLKFHLPLTDKPYIIVPEITGCWEFRAWLHEIGHYVYKHYDDKSKPRFMREYEAEKFCMDKCRECRDINSYDMIDIKYSAVGYLDSHIDRAIKEMSIKCYSDIPEEVVEFLHQCEYMKEELKNKFINMYPKNIEYQNRIPEILL